jgi:hypothetical protein
VKFKVEYVDAPKGLLESKVIHIKPYSSNFSRKYLNNGIGEKSIEKIKFDCFEIKDCKIKLCINYYYEPISQVVRCGITIYFGYKIQLFPDAIHLGASEGIIPFHRISVTSELINEFLMWLQSLAEETLYA